MRVIVCGGRDFNNRGLVFGFLGEFHAETPITHLIEGGAKGVDALAREWACVNNIKSTTCIADWKLYGRGAGPVRNQKMLEMEPECVIAFAGGSGTEDQVRRAIQKGINVIRVSG